MALAASCSDGASAPGAPAHDGGEVDSIAPFPDAGLAGDAGEGGAAIGTTFRLAHVSPDLGPIDICYRAALAEWVGPVFGAPSDAGADDAAVSDGGAPSPPGTLPFASVTSYFTVRGSGTFDVAVITAGELSCGRPRAIGHVTLDPGKRATVVVMGAERADAGSLGALTVAAFTDDPTFVTASARTRIIHAALGDARSPPLGMLSASVIASGSTFSLASGIAPAHVATSSATAPAIDGFGYHLIGPIPEPAALRVETTATADAGSGASWETGAGDLRLTAGSLHTGFIVRDASGVAVLWCNDRSSGTLATECTLLRAL